MTGAPCLIADIVWASQSNKFDPGLSLASKETSLVCDIWLVFLWNLEGAENITLLSLRKTWGVVCVADYTPVPQYLAIVLLDSGPVFPPCTIVGFLVLWISQAWEDNGHKTYLSVFRLIVGRQALSEAEVLEDVYWLQTPLVADLWNILDQLIFLKTDVSKDFLPNWCLGTDIYYLFIEDLTLPDETTMKLRNIFCDCFFAGSLTYKHT